jgi:hypothetical protein
MRYVWLTLITLLYGSYSAADEHRWFLINDTNAACESLDGAHVAFPPLHGVKTPTEVLALIRKNWPDAELVPFVDFITKRHIPEDSIPVDYHRLTKSNAFVLASAAQNKQFLLLRDDACSRIDSDAH